MNLRLLAKHLGTVSLLIGATMVFSLPWALPQLGARNESAAATAHFETDGFVALVFSILISVTVGVCLKWWGQTAQGELFRKEAMAVVGLSWVLATFLGALPFVSTGTLAALQELRLPVRRYVCLFQAQQVWIPEPCVGKMLSRIQTPAENRAPQGAWGRPIRVSMII